MKRNATSYLDLNKGFYFNVTTTSVPIFVLDYRMPTRSANICKVETNSHYQKIRGGGGKLIRTVREQDLLSSLSIFVTSQKNSENEKLFPGKQDEQEKCKLWIWRAQKTWQQTNEIVFRCLSSHWGVF